MTDYVVEDGDDVDDRVLNLLRRAVVTRFARRDAYGDVAYCRCSPADQPTRRKVTYDDRDDAWLAARALVQLPRAKPIKLYRCDLGVGRGGWHHTSRVPTGDLRPGPRLVLPPNWCESPKP